MSTNNREPLTLSSGERQLFWMNVKGKEGPLAIGVHPTHWREEFERDPSQEHDALAVVILEHWSDTPVVCGDIVFDPETAEEQLRRLSDLKPNGETVRLPFWGLSDDSTICLSLDGQLVVRTSRNGHTIEPDGPENSRLYLDAWQLALRVFLEERRRCVELMKELRQSATPA